MTGNYVNVPSGYIVGRFVSNATTSAWHPDAIPTSTGTLAGTTWARLNPDAVWDPTTVFDRGGFIDNGEREREIRYTDVMHSEIPYAKDIDCGEIEAEEDITIEELLGMGNGEPK